MFIRLNPALLCLGLLAAAPALVAPAQAAPDPMDSPAWWLSAAQADANQLTDPAEKAGVFTTLAFDFADSDKSQADLSAASAAQAASQMSDPMTRFNAFLALAGYYDQAGRSDLARTALDSAQSALPAIPPGPASQEAAARLKQFRAIVAGIATARIPLDAMTDPAGRAQAFAALADTFARAGSSHQQDAASALSAASAAADLVKDPGQKQMLKSMIVQAQARDGDADAAVAGISGLTDPAAISDAYAALADQYIRQNQNDKAADAIAHMTAQSAAAADDRRAAIWLNIARLRQAMGDKTGAAEALNAAVSAAVRLEAADRADCLAAVARLRAELGDAAGAAVAAGDAAAAVQSVTDPIDGVEVNLAVAAAQARCGLGTDARQSIDAAQSAGGRIPPDKRRPEGDPPPQAYMDLIQAAAAAGDFSTAQAITGQVGDPHVRHDAALAIAAAEVDLSQYQAAEDTVRNEGSADAEAGVCGIIAASLARTRFPAQAEQWIERLNSASDKVAARLAVVQVLQEKKQ